jgi:ribonucleotide monophosphatase NagD (HAD superfamily)
VDTDIAAAAAAGCPSVLVLGGVSEDAGEWDAIASLIELLD